MEDWITSRTTAFIKVFPCFLPLATVGVTILLPAASLARVAADSSIGLTNT